MASVNIPSRKTQSAPKRDCPEARCPCCENSMEGWRNERMRRPTTSHQRKWCCQPVATSWSQRASIVRPGRCSANPAHAVRKALPSDAAHCQTRRRPLACKARSSRQKDSRNSRVRAEDEQWVTCASGSEGHIVVCGKCAGATTDEAAALVSNQAKQPIELRLVVDLLERAHQALQAGQEVQGGIGIGGERWCKVCQSFHERCAHKLQQSLSSGHLSSPAQLRGLPQGLRQQDRPQGWPCPGRHRLPPVMLGPLSFPRA